MKLAINNFYKEKMEIINDNYYSLSKANQNFVELI